MANFWHTPVYGNWLTRNKKIATLTTGLIRAGQVLKPFLPGVWRLRPRLRAVRQSSIFLVVSTTVSMNQLHDFDHDLRLAVGAAVTAATAVRRTGAACCCPGRLVVSLSLLETDLAVTIGIRYLKVRPLSAKQPSTPFPLKRLIMRYRRSRIEQHALLAQPFGQSAGTNAFENAGVEAGQPQGFAAFAGQTFAFHHHLQCRVFDIKYPAHVDHDDTRLMLFDQLLHLVMYLLGIGKKQAAFRSEDEQAGEGFVIRVFG